MKIRYGKRTAISPIIATVLIIAVTLIAAVAIAGFVFGVFGSASSTANVGVTSVGLSHIAVSGSAVVVGTCTTTVPGGSFLYLTNTGSAGTTALSMSITYGGITNAGNIGGCTIPAGGSIYVPITNVPIVAGLSSYAGVTFNGYVVTGNGAQVLFTGTFT